MVLARFVGLVRYSQIFVCFIRKKRFQDYPKVQRDSRFVARVRHREVRAPSAVEKRKLIVKE